MRTKVYDYAVVGGGSAGAIVAARLSQAGADVLLLEAGGSDRKLSIRIPAAVGAVYSKANWGYITEPDPSRNGAEDARSAGKILGGGGSVNSTVYVRGHRADFDGWANGGASGWDFESVLPAFKRLETWERGENDHRGGSGPIAVRVQTNRSVANMAFLEASRQAGYLRNPDYNGSTGLEGAALTQVNQRRGFRSQSSQEYLHRVASRDHLELITNSTVLRVLTERSRAVGVEYRVDGAVQQAYVREEVVLSAGVFGSPTILLRSGIGPRRELADVGVDVVADVPGVGKNLHDHIMVAQPYLSRVPTINKRRPRDFFKGFTDFVLHGRGILTTTLAQVMAMHRTDPTLEAPDDQIFFADFAVVRETTAAGKVRIRPAKVEGFLAANAFLTPRGRGEIRLRSSGPDDMPLIRHDLLADPDDVRDVLTCMAELRNIMGQQAMQAVVAEPFEANGRCRTDADWEAYARKIANAPSHPAGTCKMGVDDMAVVDPDLRVNGVTGLRVVDAAVMPAVTRGNTNAPTMMIAERAMDFILGASNLAPAVHEGIG